MRPYILALILAPALLSAQDTTRLRWVPNPRTTNGTWVADPARHLRGETVAAMNTILSTLERETSAEMAVVVIDSLDGLEPEDAALLLHRRWGVGKAARDNGIVLLWSPKLRRIYASVGYGLEGVLPDARTGRIQDGEMIPLFRRNDFDGGMLAGVSALAAAAREETYSGMRRARVETRVGRSLWPGIALITVPLLAILGALFMRSRPKRCPKGHGPMQRLAETDDDLVIGTAGALEEKLGSMNYDVWACGICDESLIVPHRKWFSSYQACPKCKRRTVKVTSKQVSAPTYASTGLKLVTRTCKNCRWTETKEQTIPMLVHASSGSSGGSSGGGGGGSSFGGGSSGGGGAGRSY